MIIDSVCFKCRRFHDGVWGMKCDAFPEGIPDPIAVEGHDHIEAYPGDHGLRFEPKDGVENEDRDEPKDHLRSQGQ